MTPARPCRATLARLSCIASVGSCLAALPLLHSGLGRERGPFAGFALATALAIAHWRAMLPERRSSLGPLVLGGMLGLVSFPALLLLVSSLGLAMGLAPRVVAGASFASALPWLMACVFAPVFEELLFRAAILGLLRDRMDWRWAVLLSSLAFASVHPSAWGLLGGSVVGVGLASVMLLFDRVELCIGIHAGLNLASFLVGPVPAPEWVVASLVVSGGVALLAVVWWLRVVRLRRRRPGRESRIGAAANWRGEGGCRPL